MTHSRSLLMRARRWLRHALTTRGAGRRAFPPAALQTIEAAIAAGEARYEAEVALIVEARLPLSSVAAGIHARGRAADLFSHYRLWDTESNCAILIYINLADHKVEIVADRGVARLLTKDEWHAICQTMTDGFRHGAYAVSVLAALSQMGDLLHERAPRTTAGSNELPNQSIIL